MKQLAKTALCGLYKYSGAALLPEAVARWRGRSFAVVLLFHRVTDEIPEDGLTVSTARFRRICRMLRRAFRVVPLAEVFRLVRSGEDIPPRTAAVTFDDCYRDNLFAARTLAEFGLPACFFIPTAFVGTGNVFDWDRGLRPMPNLTWDEVREMAGLGHEIGSHTVSHADMGAVPAEQARYELAESKSVLEEKLGRPVRWFAYPFGGRSNFSEERLRLVEEVGYEGCVSAYGGFVYRGTDPRLLPREAVPYFQNVLNLELYLRGALHWLYALKRRVGLQKEYVGPYSGGSPAPPPGAPRDVGAMAGTVSGRSPE